MIKLVLTCAFGLVACGGKLPETRFYQLAPPVTPPAKPATDDVTLALENFETDAGYDDERIIYRTTPYRLDYYQYHRWSAAPGVIVGNFLEQSFEKSGLFTNVSRDSEHASASLRGRVIAMEEVDRSKTQWHGRLVLELALVDPKTSETLWSEQFEEIEPLRTQSPEGLAEALSIAMTRIANRATPAIADHARRRAQLTARTQ